MPRKKSTVETKENTVTEVNEVKEPAKKTAPRTKTAKAVVAEEAPAKEDPTAKVVDTRDEEIALLKEQLNALKKEMEAKAAQPQIVVTAPDNGERVHLLWQAEVANDNVVEFGDGGMYGRIVGKTGSIYVPKNDLSRILDSANRLYLDKRWLIVVSGLTDDEREALGVAYKEGELLEKKVFQNLLKLGKDELLEIYPELCESHKEMIAKRFYEAYTSGKHVDRDTVVALNNIAPSEAFKAVINGMNEDDLK